MSFLIFFGILYIIHLMKGLYDLLGEGYVEDEDDWTDYNIDDSNLISEFNRIEDQSLKLARIANNNEMILSVMKKYEQSGIEIPLELYAKCVDFTTEKEMMNYLEVMRKNYARNLNMKLIKPAKSAMESKK